MKRVKYWTVRGWEDSGIREVDGKPASFPGFVEVALDGRGATWMRFPGEAFATRFEAEQKLKQLAANRVKSLQKRLTKVQTILSLLEAGLG